MGNSWGRDYFVTRTRLTEGESFLFGEERIDESDHEAASGQTTLSFDANGDLMLDWSSASSGCVLGVKTTHSASFAKSCGTFGFGGTAHHYFCAYENVYDDQGRFVGSRPVKDDVRVSRLQGRAHNDVIKILVE